MLIRTLVALGAIVPVAFLASISLITEVPDIFDSCHQWGDDPGPRIQPSARCPRVSWTSVSRLGTIARLSWIQLGSLFGAILGAIGIHRSWYLLPILGVTILFYNSVLLLLGSFAPFTILSGSMILIAMKIPND